MNILLPISIVLGTVNLALLCAVMLFCCNIFLIISWLFLRPVSEKLHQSILNFCLANFSLNFLINWAESFGGLKLIVTGDMDAILNLHKGSKVVISNHVSYTDSIIVYAIGRAVGQHGNIRSFAKKTLMYMPLMGWFWYFLNFIFVSRDWDKDKAYIKRQLHNLKRMATLHSTNSFWLLMFPEGTRISSKKLTQAQEFAKARNLPVLDHLLVPRVKGLQASLDAVHDALDGVVDITIGYPERTPRGGARPSLWTLFFFGAFSARRWPVHVHVRVVPIAKVPSEPEAVSTWAMELFHEKDRLLAGFLADGKFPGEHWQAYRPTGRLGALSAMLQAAAAAALVAAGMAASAAAAAAALA